MNRLLPTSVLAIVLALVSCGPGIEEGSRVLPPADGRTPDRGTAEARRLDTSRGEGGACLCDNNYSHYQAHRLYYCSPPLDTRLCAAGSNQPVPGQLNLYDRSCLRELTPGYFELCT
jgi:hypothetical protein